MPHRHRRRPALDIDTSRFDVIVGEVKTAEAELNPALLTPGALHATLRRIATCSPPHSTKLSTI